jgi:hypothetical protein
MCVVAVVPASESCTAHSKRINLRHSLDTDVRAAALTDIHKSITGHLFYDETGQIQRRTLAHKLSPPQTDICRTVPTQSDLVKLGQTWSNITLTYQ